MSNTDNKELMRKMYEFTNTYEGNPARLRSVYETYATPEYVYHHLFKGDMNREGCIQYMTGALAAFPDAIYTVDDIMAEGDKVTIRYTMQATHKGSFAGFAPTGKKITAKGVEIDRIEEGKIAETWDFPDYLSLLRQMRAIRG